MAGGGTPWATVSGEGRSKSTYLGRSVKGFGLDMPSLPRGCVVHPPYGQQDAKDPSPLQPQSRVIGVLAPATPSVSGEKLNPLAFTFDRVFGPSRAAEDKIQCTGSMPKSSKHDVECRMHSCGHASKPCV